MGVKKRLIRAKIIRESASGKAYLIEVTLMPDGKDKKEIWFPRTNIRIEDDGSIFADPNRIFQKERKELQGREMVVSRD